MIRWAFGALVALTFTSLALAQHCAPAVRSSYVAPAFVQEAAVYSAAPLVVPVFSYVAAPQAAFSQMQQPQPAIDAEKIADMVIQKLKAKGLQVDDDPPPLKAISFTEASGDIHRILGGRCVSCHAGDATAGGGLALFDTSKRLLPMSRESRWDVFDSVYSGRMPKGGPEFTDSELETVRAWARRK